MAQVHLTLGRSDIVENNFLGVVTSKTVVTSISPSDIGLGGGTVNIHGDGFATDGFSQFDQLKGNKVSCLFHWVPYSHKCFRLFFPMS